MKTLPLLVALANLTFMSGALAVVQTSTGTFKITSNGGVQVNLAKYTGSLTSLQSIQLLLDVTSIDFTENVNGNNGTPSATFQDQISVNNGIPATVNFDTSFTASGPLAQSSNKAFTFDSATGTVFLNFPDIDIGSITQNFSNYQGSSGTWSDTVSSDISIKTSSGGSFVNTSGISVQGTLEVFYNETAAIPEPSAWDLILVSMGGVLVLRRLRGRV
jgi:hypothetical protein